MTTNEPQPNPNRLTREAMIARVSDLVIEMAAVFDTDEYTSLVEEITFDEHPEIGDADDDLIAAYQSDVEARIASALFFELHRILFTRY